MVLMARYSSTSPVIFVNRPISPSVSPRIAWNFFGKIVASERMNTMMRMTMKVFETKTPRVRRGFGPCP